MTATRLGLSLLLAAGLVRGQEQDLQRRVAELERKVETLDQELERSVLGDLIPAVGESKYGLGPAASKIYAKEQGLSLGGYGEFLYQQRSGNPDRFDALRAVTYIGYKFDDRFLFNSEIEIEHGSTSASSGTTDGQGSVSLEFGYIDYLHQDEINARGGLLLVPMGFVNELHEPTSFLPATRPQTETRILPTTWRALGAGMFGDVGPFAYRAYLVTSLDGEEFTSSGLREGRQKGNRAAADDFAGVVRVDYVDTPGLIVGGSAYYGMTGQDNIGKNGARIPDMGLTILEGHAAYETGPWQIRGLVAVAFVDDAGAFNSAAAQSLAETLLGYYVEGGYDVFAALLPELEQSLIPFVRYEHIDTQWSMPSGFVPDPTEEDDIVTLGLGYKPIDQIVIKADFEIRDTGDDQFNLLLGYVF